MRPFNYLLPLVWLLKSHQCKPVFLLIYLVVDRNRNLTVVSDSDSQAPPQPHCVIEHLSEFGGAASLPPPETYTERLQLRVWFIGKCGPQITYRAVSVFVDGCDEGLLAATYPD